MALVRHRKGADRLPLSGAEKHLLILSFSGFDPVVGPRADIPSSEQLVAVRIPLSPIGRPRSGLSRSDFVLWHHSDLPACPRFRLGAKRTSVPSTIAERPQFMSTRRS